MAVDLIKLKSENVQRWSAAKLTRGPEFTPVAKRLVAAKARYQAVEHATSAPWPFIAVTHQRESSQNWERSLAQGDPWNEVSKHLPAGRGPFGSWEAAAIDALVNCGPYAARNKDWSIGGTLTKLEQYNGVGYFKCHRPALCAIAHTAGDDGWRSRRRPTPSASVVAGSAVSVRTRPG